MKTLKSVVTTDERYAKFVGAIINSLLTIGGAMFIICAIKFFVEKNHLFGF